MQTKITIRNEAQTCYIDIEGTIGVPEEHQFEDASSRVATFESFRREVKRIAEVAAKSVVVNIRSTGGDVNDALLIYDALRQLDATITTRCYGYTASAATIIAQAADEGGREISSSALYLIHNATCSIDGNASSLDSRAELLRKTDEQLSRLYALHSGRDAEFFATLMAENNGEGKWLTAEEAIEAGLADRLIDFEEESEPSEREEQPEQPEQPEKGEQGEQGEKTEQTEKQPEKQSEKQEQSMPADSATTRPRRKRAMEKQSSAETAWGSIIRYLLNRLAVRIDEWIESLREKRKAQEQAEKEAARNGGGNGNGEGEKGRGSRSRRKQKEEMAASKSESNEESKSESKGESKNESKGEDAPAEGVDTNAGQSASISDAAAQSDDKAVASSMPKASATSSPLHFVERQRCYAASRLRSVEDPSVRGASLYSNEQAYSEDVKAFER